MNALKNHLEVEFLKSKTYQEINDMFNELKSKYEAETQKASRKAKLWDAFCSNGRIRVLGSAKLGQEGYQHIGFELWTFCGMPEDDYDFTEESKNSLQQLEIYLDAWIKTQAKSPPEGDAGE